MKGKIAFVVGLAVGYVFGTKAGRERYEQIKAGAASLWETQIMKQGRDQLGGYVSDLRSNVQDSVIEAGRNFLQTLVVFTKSDAASRAASSKPASARTTSADAKSSATKTSSAKRSSTAKSSAAKTQRKSSSTGS